MTRAQTRACRPTEASPGGAAPHNHHVRYLLSILHIETYNNDILTVFCAGWPAVLHISVCKHNSVRFYTHYLPQNLKYA